MVEYTVIKYAQVCFQIPTIRLRKVVKQLLGTHPVSHYSVLMLNADLATHQVTGKRLKSI